MTIQLPAGMWESAMEHYETEGVHSASLGAALQGSLDDLPPDGKRELAASLLRAANADEGYQET